MEKKLNLKIKEDLSIKYHLNMHLMDSFLDDESIMFEIIKYVDNDIRSNDKDSNLDKNWKFSSKTLKYIFKDMMSDASFKDKVVTTLKKYISEGLLEPNGKSIHITENLITKFYIINQ